MGYKYAKHLVSPPPTLVTTKPKCLACGVAANLTASGHITRRFRNFKASRHNLSGHYAPISLIGTPSGVPHMNLAFKHSEAFFWE